jgi:hypothetical protein
MPRSLDDPKTIRSPELGLERFLLCNLHEVKQARDFLSRLVELRLQEEQLVRSFNASSGSVPPVVANPPTKGISSLSGGLASGEHSIVPGPSARKPMRPPRPGTTRAIIYAFLSMHKGEPVTRLQIVQEIGRSRGVSLKTCEKSVAAVLENKYDPHIERVRYGEYAYRETLPRPRLQSQTNGAEKN